MQRETMDLLKSLNQHALERDGDPEIATRINSYEMAFKMQASAPELMDISKESKETLELYGATPGKASYANNCLLARRLIERGVRFVQLNHEAWDHHGGLPKGIRRQCQDIDRACYALVTDLKRKGMLDDTLVVWGGEFGRTNYSQGKLTATDYGRDHHPRCFTVWLAGAGVKAGTSHGQTDDFSYNIAADGVHVHDLHATILHLLGIDHTRLTFRFQGRDYRLTDVHGNVVKQVLA